MAISHGILSYVEGKWVMSNTPPHVSLILKNVFPQLSKSSAGPFKFLDTPEQCSNLLWFMNRYHMDMEPGDLRRLRKGKKIYDEVRDEVERLLLPDHIPVPHQFKMGYAERNYQARAREMFLKVNRMICGDDLGLGKTTVALGAFMDPKTLPALVVVQTHLPKQWEDRILEFTELKVHRIEGTKPYNLPPADVYIMKYSCLSGWVDLLRKGFFKSVTFDECQELRKEGSNKYNAAKIIAGSAQYVLGLTATLIYNYGDEVFNIFDIIKPGCLGLENEFKREWTTNGRVIADPAALGSYLRSQHLFLRRTRHDVQMEMPAVNRVIHEVEANYDEIKKVEDLVVQLSMKVLSGTFFERGEAARSLDLMLRMQTGIAKAGDVAAYVRLLLENRIPVILVGWHRAVYDMWLEELAAFKPVMYTGSETGTQKENSKNKFLSGETDLMIMSLRSGAGIDGLQSRCCTMIFGELDWSPKVHDQLIGRIDRPGQKEMVMAAFIVCNHGSDPPMIDVLGLKSSQSTLIIDPTFEVTEHYSDDSRIKQMAMSFLKKKGIAIPEKQLDSSVNSVK